MRLVILTALVIAAGSVAQQPEPPRDSMDFVIGGLAWLPGLLNEDNGFGAGYGFLAGVETPMFQDDQFRITAGPAFCGSDNDQYDGVTAIMLNLGYRKYPFYRRYAGARALEPFIGLTGGGILVWDSPSSGSDAESESTGGAMLGLEVGTRIRLNESTRLDLSLSGEWVPVGKALAGEEEEDLSGITVRMGLVF